MFPHGTFLQYVDSGNPATLDPSAKIAKASFKCSGIVEPRIPTGQIHLHLLGSGHSEGPSPDYS